MAGLFQVFPGRSVIFPSSTNFVGLGSTSASSPVSLWTRSRPPTSSNCPCPYRPPFHRRRGGALLGLAVCVAVLAAACTNSDPSESATGSSAPSSPTFETTGDAGRCDNALRQLELVNHATSLGGVESTVERRATREGQQRIPQTLVRMSVGCENVDDLWTDLDQALTSTAGS